ncbi:AAA family ATPase [Chromobacterium alkanivorans]|uniref:AAA family ATPase n=1 Tax=Chromobacterium alkanivorans TaxID=1071719 RepID=UPI001967AB4B|nr:AAA family ATPase [Chromobacterium alkanivorans]MBN3002519.1 AAA family ATPase [Chromobacterium alkanivorans]
MPILVRALKRGEYLTQSERGANTVVLAPSTWDDYSYKTLFSVVFYNSGGREVEIGTVKIGYFGQPTGWTIDTMQPSFGALPENYFSLGQDVDYYKNLQEELSEEERKDVLMALRDVVFIENLFSLACKENVFANSLTRSVSLSVIDGQFRRVLQGKAILTDFLFAYHDRGNERNAKVYLTFQVDPKSKPATNIHVLIGRNGVGKTTILNGMVGAIFSQSSVVPKRVSFYESLGENGAWTALSSNYFSSIVSVSFSAFDPFVPPVDQPDRSRGVAYFYVGMKKSRFGEDGATLLPPKTEVDLANDFVESLQSCLSQPAKRDRWLTAISRLESDSNFADMNLSRLGQGDNDELVQDAYSLMRRMSSGHSIVLLTITKLVDLVEEKTLVLMDEPESHLHPPLLSAFTRALSDLLHNRNGVAIIATHSPVVVQEVPRSCVWKLTRLRAEGRSDRPDRETFGENVGVLTREIFGLEVSKSGFHDVLQQEVDKGGSFDEILRSYNGQLGFEAQAILQALITSRNNVKGGI